MALSSRWPQIGTAALMPSLPCALNCRGGWREGQLCPETGRCGLQVCCSSSMGTGCWRVHARRRWSSINSSATLGSTEFPKVFEVLRLDKEVSAEKSSGGPLPSSSRAIEKAMKVDRTAESFRLTDPVCTEEICQAEYEKLETDTGEGARGSPHPGGAWVKGLWCVDASAYGRDGNAVLHIDNKSSPLLGCREISMDVEASDSEEVDSRIENLSFTRIGDGDGFSIEDIDDNHYQDACADLENSISKADFWPAIEVEKTLTKGQVIDKCVAFDQWRQYQPVMQDPEKHADSRHFNRCIHHLLAVLSLPRVTTIDKEPICCEPEQMLGSRGGRKMSTGIVSRTSGSDEFYLHKPFLQLWNGFWVGPDDEDGWGFVEALVSPVDIDGPLCRT